MVNIRTKPKSKKKEPVNSVVTLDDFISNLGNTGNSSGNTFEGNSSGNTDGEYVHVDRMDSPDDLEFLPRAEVDRRLQLEKYKVESHKARAAKFETDIREGKLLLAEDVAKHDAEMGSRLKKKLLALPTELAVRVAAITSPAEVESLLRAEITDALNEFLDAYGVHYS